MSRHTVWDAIAAADDIVQTALHDPAHGVALLDLQRGHFDFFGIETPVDDVGAPTAIRIVIIITFTVSIIIAILIIVIVVIGICSSTRFAIVISCISLILIVRGILRWRRLRFRFCFCCGKRLVISHTQTFIHVYVLKY